MVDRDKNILKGLDQVLRGKVVALLGDVNSKELPHDCVLRVFEGYRTEKAQREAYLAGKSKLLRGKHNLNPSHACDLVFCVDGTWSWDTKLPYWLVGSSAEAHGLTWGGRYGTSAAARKEKPHNGMEMGWDPYHVELD